MWALKVLYHLLSLAILQRLAQRAVDRQVWRRWMDACMPHYRKALRAFPNDHAEIARFREIMAWSFAEVHNHLCEEDELARWRARRQ